MILNIRYPFQFFFYFFLVINIEVAETAISFFAFQNIYWQSNFFLAGVILDVVQIFSFVFILIFLCHFGSIDPSN